MQNESQLRHRPVGRLSQLLRPPVAAIGLGVVVALVSACGGGASESASPAEPADAATGEGACAGPVRATAEGWVDPVVDEATPELPSTVLDFSGDEVTVEDASRILALDTYGTLGATVYALGLGDRLVGRDISTGVPELAGLPVVTQNGHELNAEAILELDPTVILTDYSIGPLEVQLQLRDSGIPVVILDSVRNREVIGEQIREVAGVLGVPEAGELLAEQVDADVDAAEREVAALRQRAGVDPRMVFLYLRGTAGVYYWFGAGSGADDLIDALGGVDVASETGLEGNRPLNAEGLVRAAPDAFLMMTEGLASVGGAEGLAEVPGVADTAAGSTSCVVDMGDAEILSFGPQFPATLRALGEAVYGPDGLFAPSGVEP